MLALKRRVEPAEVEDVLARLQRRMPHVLAQVNRETQVDQLPLDSLDLVGFLCATEDEFGVRLTSGAVMRAGTVGRLAMLIARRTRKEKANP
jgi:acyl carrier protein